MATTRIHHSTRNPRCCSSEASIKFIAHHIGINRLLNISFILIFIAFVANNILRVKSANKSIISNGIEKNLQTRRSYNDIRKNNDERVSENTSNEDAVDAYYFCTTIIESYLMKNMCDKPELSSIYGTCQNTNDTIFYDMQTPQGQAFDWIIHDPFSIYLICTGTYYSDDKLTILQRYILAILFYSTRGDEIFLDDIYNNQHNSTSSHDYSLTIEPNEDWTIHGSLNFLTSDNHECAWYIKHRGTIFGVKACNEKTQSVTELFLPDLSLDGTIPEELGLLSSLEVLNFQNNYLSGSIPQSFGRLTNLRSLALGHNNFIGTLPESMGSLRSLEILYINFNNMHGKGVIPSSVCELYDTGRLFNTWADCSGIFEPVECDCCTVCCDSLTKCGPKLLPNETLDEDDDDTENRTIMPSKSHRNKRTKQRIEEDEHHDEKWFQW